MSSSSSSSSSTASSGGDEPPWKRVRRTSYHRQRYGTVAECALDMSADTNPWRYDAPRRRDVWLVVWAHCSFHTLYACSRVCRRWRAELLASGGNADVWGVGGVSGEWLVACLPLLAKQPAMAYKPNFRFALHLTKEEQWQTRVGLRRFVLTAKVAKSLPGHATTLETAVRTAASQWQTPSTLRVGYQRRRDADERRRGRTDARRILRRRLMRTLEGTLLHPVNSTHVDARVRRVMIDYIARGEIALPAAVKALTRRGEYTSTIYRPLWLWRERERSCVELMRRHSRSVLRDPSTTQPVWRSREVWPLEIYRVLFDWTLVRFNGGSEAPPEVFEKFKTACLVSGGGGGDGGGTTSETH